MEHRIPRPDLQRQVESYLHGCLQSEGISVHDLAAALVNIAYDREDNPIRALFRKAQQDTAATSTSTCHAPSRVEEAVASSSAVRQKASKLSLRFGRKSDKEKHAIAAANGNFHDASLSSTNDSSNWRKPVVGLFERPNANTSRPSAALPQHQPVVPLPASYVVPAYVGELQKHGLLDKGDVYPSVHNGPQITKAESETPDEKRGFFAFGTSPKRVKGKPKTDDDPSLLCEYSCVFCQKSDKTYSSKGTCKRHLEEMHVAKKSLQCNECGQKTSTVPDARKHAAQCSSRNVGWHQVKPGGKKLYSSEFAEIVFESQQLYVEHLLELCAKPVNQRPPVSWHTKLRNLLSHEVPASCLQEVSLRLLGDPQAWRSARWDFDRIHRACKELEHGILDHELHAGDLLRLRRKEAFVEDLFKSRLVSRSSSTNQGSSSAQTENPHAPDLGYQQRFKATAEAAPAYSGNQSSTTNRNMVNSQNGYMHVANAYLEPEAAPGAMEVTEPSTKRPLSYETASAVPIRYPPGPSPATIQTGDSHVYCEVYNRALGFAAHDPMSASVSGTMSPAFSNAQWPMQEQPPPYDCNLRAAATTYPTPMQSHHASHGNNEALELPIAATYSEDVSQAGAFAQLNLQQGDNILHMYNTGAAHQAPDNITNEHTMYDNYIPPQSVAQEHVNWNSWYDPTQANQAAFANYGGDFGHGQQ